MIVTSLTWFIYFGCGHPRLTIVTISWLNDRTGDGLWRLLNRMKHESWAADAIDMMYFDDDQMEWAKATGEHLESENDEMHRDSNGALLQTGDSVTLIKSLDVKGSQINAKIGTVVKNIKLVADNTAQIEGKIEGQQIVILTKFVRKSS